MNEQQQRVTATNLIEDLQSKGAQVDGVTHASGFGERHITTTTRQPNESFLTDGIDSSLQVTEDVGRPQNAGSAHTAQKKDGMYTAYGGHIAPMAFDYSQPKVVREGADPKSGEPVKYKHEFKDTRKAGQLIAKLAAKRIEKSIPSEEDGVGREAA